ncbi:2-phospho-L-lactate guanylyltransferase [Rhizocola hellebori]|uniref:2-phospho-L-lactate guanylyltransferase n=1 Tax=Rhizocola hellebori TaxID=1392758 RepID=A0A8J3Q6V1_9ACTN|nr:2-phospho-L-lactate guanylyltransferase [Rhizocola hellebori]GIH04489.1 2-phospho-L-lactate guanylyltransferase [Rhizocola hellebori]
MSADRFTLLVPLKPLAAAKSRLRGAVPGTRHEDLVLTLATATLEAAAASPAVARVIVISNEPLAGFETLPDPHQDLNAALVEVARRLSGPLAAIPADLPALRPAELTQALELCTTRSFVPDAEGTGTVLLAAPFGDLDPRFGPGSADAHESSGAVRLSGDWPTLRRDVDTLADLAAVKALGWSHAGHHLRV